MEHSTFDLPCLLTCLIIIAYFWHLWPTARCIWTQTQFEHSQHQCSVSWGFIIANNWGPSFFGKCWWGRLSTRPAFSWCFINLCSQLQRPHPLSYCTHIQQFRVIAAFLMWSNIWNQCHYHGLLSEQTSNWPASPVKQRNIAKGTTDPRVEFILPK